jgi:hypothetical protein
MVRFQGTSEVLPMARPKKDKPKATSKPRKDGASPVVNLNKDKPKARSKPRKDEAREQRIDMEIVVDAYNEDERVMGWSCYLEDKLNVPFHARCIEEREVSPLEVGDEVEVTGMSPESDRLREMFVTILWGERDLAVPLGQLEVVKADKSTREGVEDWHYWLAMGYQF